MRNLARVTVVGVVVIGSLVGGALFLRSINPTMFDAILSPADQAAPSNQHERDSWLAQLDRENPPAFRQIRDMAAAINRNDYASMCEYSPKFRRGNYSSPFGCGNYVDLFYFEFCAPSAGPVGRIALEERTVAQYSSSFRDPMRSPFCEGQGDEWSGFPPNRYFQYTVATRLIGECSEEDRDFGCVEMHEIDQFVRTELGYQNLNDFLVEVAFQHLINGELNRALTVRFQLSQQSDLDSELTRMLDDLLEDEIRARNAYAPIADDEWVVARYPTHSVHSANGAFEEWLSDVMEVIERHGSNFGLFAPSFPVADIVSDRAPIYCFAAWGEAPETGLEFGLAKFPGDVTIHPVFYGGQIELFQEPGTRLRSRPSEPRLIDVRWLRDDEHREQKFWVVPSVAGWPDLTRIDDSVDTADARDWGAHTDGALPDDWESTWQSGSFNLYSAWFPSGSEESRSYHFPDHPVDTGRFGMSVISPGMLQSLDSVIAALDEACPH